MKPTTQAELLVLAKLYTDNPAVRILVTSIEEARAAASMSHAAVHAHLGVQYMALAGAEGFRVMLDNSGFVAEASKLAASLTRMAVDFMNLASVLESLGEPVSY